MWFPSQPRTSVLYVLVKRGLAMLDRSFIVLFLISCVKVGISQKGMELGESLFTTARSETSKMRIFLSSTLDQGK